MRTEIKLHGELPLSAIGAFGAARGARFVGRAASLVGVEIVKRTMGVSSEPLAKGVRANLYARAGPFHDFLSCHSSPLLGHCASESGRR